jgi:hypothetical protein
MMEEMCRPVTDYAKHERLRSFGYAFRVASG